MTEHRATCKDCGEYLEGDGFKRVIHCPNLEEISYDEPDAGPIYCGWIEDQAPQPAPAVQVEPVAYAVFADNGDIRIWCADPIHAEKLRMADGDQVRPLYLHPQPAPDAPLLEAFDAGRRAAQAEATELAGALDGMIEAADVASWGGYFPDAAITRAVEALAAYRKGGDT